MNGHKSLATASVNASGKESVMLDLAIVTVAGPKVEKLKKIHPGCVRKRGRQ